MKRKRGPLKRLIRRRRRDLVVHLVIAAYRLVRVLPRCAGLRIFSGLGAIASLVLRKDFDRTCTHLGMVYGDGMTPAGIRSMARGVFAGAGRNLFDAVKILHNQDYWFDRLVSSDVNSAFERDCRKGGGVLVATAHLGCFELLFPYVARKGYRAMAVGQRLFDPRIDDIVRAVRSGTNREYFSRSDSPLALVRRWRNGGVLGVLLDQDTRVEGVFAPFLGRLAFTPSGLVRLAVRFRIPIYVMTTARQKDEKHHIFIEGPVESGQTQDEAGAVVETVEAINDCLSGKIREFPLQWVWMHRRWKSRPR